MSTIAEGYNVFVEIWNVEDVEVVIWGNIDEDGDEDGTNENLFELNSLFAKWYAIVCPNV